MAEFAHRILAGSQEGGILSGVGPLSDTLNLFLVQAVIILGICRILGLMGSYLGQPKVIFEIIGGIILGPSAIGRNKAYLTTIFPTASLGYLGIVANIGLVLYLFIVGLELDPLLLMTHAKRAGGVAIVGMIVPFCLGVAISRTMLENLQVDDPAYAEVKFEAFLVFIGTAMSITAFPVLARILKESGLIYTVPGAMTMGAAALNDAVAWCLLILAISIAKAGNMSIAGFVFLSVIAFSAGLAFIVRPAFFKLVYLIESWNSTLWSNYLFAFTLILVFLSAWTTALLGVHAIFGSFLFGLICVPRDSHLFLECNECIEELIVTFTLPLYFALSGLKTDVTTISRPQDGAMVVLVCFVATIGKFIGAGSVVYAGGMSLRESSVVAVLMNTRGLVELIVLNLGMDAGILNIRTFSVMVIMCLFTTFITCPIIEIIYPPSIRIMMATAVAKDTTKLTSAALQTNSISVKLGSHEHNDADNYADEEAGAHPQEITFNLEDMLVHANIGVVVDRIEHLEGIMKVLWCFAPLAQNSSMEVTAMHFFEPSFTSRDVFVGLNEENKLLEVEEEITSVNLNPLQRQRDGAHKGGSAQSEMLPLCMFSKAIGAHVEAFRVKGDPMHFPGELHKRAVANEFNVVVFPWRPSPFVEQLFWGSIERLVTPVALLLQNHVVVPNVPEGQVDLRDFGTHGEDAAVRKSSDDGTRNLRERSTSSEGRHDISSPEVRSHASSSEYSTLFNRSHNSSAVKDRVVAENVSVKKVLVLITGALCDSLLLPLALRCSSNANLQVQVMITSDKPSFNPSLRAALRSFQERLRVLKQSNVTIENLSIASNDTHLIMHKLATGQRYDLIAVGFYVPEESAAASASASASASMTSPLKASKEGSGSVSSPDHLSTRASRAFSISESLVEAVSPEPSVIDHRRQIGMPEKMIQSSLQYPELGTLGCMLHASKLSTFVLIYHEPKTKLVDRMGRERRSDSIIDTLPFESLPPKRIKSDAMRPISEIDTEGSSNDLSSIG